MKTDTVKRAPAVRMSQQEAAGAGEGHRARGAAAGSRWARVRRRTVYTIDFAVKRPNKPHRAALGAGGPLASFAATRRA